VPDGERVWVGTEKSLVTFESTSDAFVEFPQAGALESQSIVGVEPFADYVFIATDVELVQFNKLKSNFRRYTQEADGIAREAGALGTVLASGQLVLLFDDGAELYEITRDLWMSRGLQATEGEGAESAASKQIRLQLDGEIPADVSDGLHLEDERYATALLEAGVGYQFEDGRSLDLSLDLDYGEVELGGIRDFDVTGEYLGTQTDVVREVQVGDELEVGTLEEGVDTTLLLSGARARLASEGAEPTVSATFDAGMRRGLSQRNFFTGARQELYQLYIDAPSRPARYVLPGSEKVYLDGELLTAGQDYTVIYPAGQLAFLDPERVDDLSIIEVEYEYDVVPKKGLGVISLLDLLPADSEVGAWVQASEPTMISEESGLYAQIDGAAPKYIDRGWRRSVYVEYQQGSRTIQLAIHDMATAEQATDIWDYDLPAAREPVADHENMVLDLGLSTSYAVRAYQDVFYIELSIDEKSDPAKQSLRLFAIQVLQRGETAGEHEIDDFRELYAGARAAWSPASGVELGVRAVQIRGLEDPNVEGERREQLTGMLDGRIEREFGDGGRVTAYAEAAASHGQRASDRDGYAAMSRLRLSHPWLEGSVESRVHHPGYSGAGSTRTMYGKLRDETRLAATAYPTKWLPTSVFLSRQDSYAPGTGTAVIQHALARMQLAHKALPATSVQVGQTLQDDALGFKKNRLKLVGETDYDLATGLLKPLGMRRFILRGLYGWSDASELDEGYYAGGDRVQVSRLEAKLAPTATETAYALYRSRESRHRDSRDNDFELSTHHWELNAGARSAVIPGVIPQVNYSVIYDDDRTVAPPEDTLWERSSNGTFSGQLGVFPGEWVGALAAVAVDARYSLGEESSSQRQSRDRPWERQSLNRLHRLDNRMSYTGTGAWEAELREIYELSYSHRDQRLDSRRLELRNRFVYRPIHASPITLRLDYVEGLTLNDQSALAGVQKWGTQRIYEGALEWLMRWSRRWTTRIRATYTVNDTRHLLQVDEQTSVPTLQHFTQHRVKPEIEIRFLLQRDTGSLFLVHRDRVHRLFGPGAVQGIAWDTSLGIIWAESDAIYLDAEVVYSENHCVREACSPDRKLVPRLLLTAKL
jgi:hypothetical protein